MKYDFDNLLNILYSPSNYTHDSYFSDFTVSRDILGDTLVNYWLIEYYKLEDLPKDWAPNGIVISLLLNHWQILSAAAHFAGGYLMRDQLMKHAATLATDSRLLSFISLPILYQANIENEFSDTHFTTIENGAAFIMSIASTLPRALQQRLALCFAHNMNKPPCVANPTPDNLNLLKMSIIYASN